MTPEDVVSVVKQLGEMLEPGAQQLWQLAQRQVLVLVVITAVWTAIGVIIASLCWRWNRQLAKVDTTDDMSLTQEETRQVAQVFSMIGVVASSVGIIIGIQTLIGYIINPDYEALQILISLIKRAL